MAEALRPLPRPATAEVPCCLNCGEALAGPYCWKCGQEDVNLSRPLRQLVADLAGELFSLDTRLLRTLRLLLLQPGALTREYLAGRRVRYVPPLKVYLIAALVFFGLIAILPKGSVSVVTGPAPKASAPAPHGSHVAFSLPEHYPLFDRQLGAAGAKAKAHPEAFADAVFANLPRVFFLLLPAFALLLALFYWKNAYYLDHLVFALHYHAFVFLDLTLLVLLGRPWVPTIVDRPLSILLIVWLLAYLPMALRRVYRGSRLKTFLKLAGLGVLYFFAFSGGVLVLVVGTLSLF